MSQWNANPLRQGIHHSVPIMRQPNRTLLGSIPQIHPSKRENMVIVVVHLKRPSLSTPWGVAVSMFNDRIIFGKVEHNGKFIIDYSHVIPARDRLLHPQLVFTYQADQGFYARQLSNYAKVLAVESPIHNHLFPGDLVLAVDGFEPGSFRSLAQFTNYLRSRTQCSLVILRHPNVTAAAIQPWGPQRFGSPFSPQTPSLSATSAEMVWKRIIDVSQVSVSPISPPVPSTPFNPKCLMTRQVTPEKVTVQRLPALAGEQSMSPVELHGMPGLKKPQQQLNHEIKAGIGATMAQPKRDGVPKPGMGVVIGGLPEDFLKRPTKKQKIDAKGPTKPAAPLPVPWRNSWFQDEKGENLPFDDNWEFSPEDGQRAQLFLPRISNFSVWLSKRKEQWAKNYQVHRYANDNSDEEFESEECKVAHDFWTPQGFSSFDEWLSTNSAKWKVSYSWNKKKRQRIQQEFEEIVHVSQDPQEFLHWLRIRRNQWRRLRRRRKRKRLKERSLRDSTISEGASMCSENAIHLDDRGCRASLVDVSHNKRCKSFGASSNEIAAIDVILEQEDQELKRRKLAKSRPFDISFLFDTSKGAPDDIVVHCLHFLQCEEYKKLLCISKSTANALKARDQVWRQLCPSHWVLPRRPRKPWHELYFHKLRIEQRDSQKRWDDLLLKCSAVLFKGDHLQKIEKLVLKGEKDFGFHVNYVSPVVCERNSLINLAVIHQRHKVVRWLVDHKGADIESYDRGHFTALLNAAWAGDRHLVRLLLQRGANREKVGYGHYSRALASPDFKGLTAEGWARKRGHEDIAKLIHYGL